MKIKELLKVLPSNIKIDFFKEHGIFKYNINGLTGNEEVTEINIETADKVNIYFEDTSYDKIRDKIILVNIENNCPVDEANEYLLELLKKKGRSNG